jgi:hypothetical protein
VHITLPGKRSLFQVSSSTGKAYTLNIDLPTRDAVEEKSNDTEVDSKAVSDGQPNVDVQMENGHNDRLRPGTSDDITEGHTPNWSPSPPPSNRVDNKQDTEGEIQGKMEQTRRVSEIMEAIKGIHCPCTGFGFNSLGGDRNIFVSLGYTSEDQCKHLLAVVLGHQMDKTVKTEIDSSAVTALLGLT